LDQVVKSGAKFDAKKATYDLLKLLNTNFDSVEVYFALADLYKSIWQLEASSIWLEQALQTSELSELLKKKAWTELADCFLWQEINLEKALEYAKSGHQGDSVPQAEIVLVHAYLKLGRIREARSHIQQLAPSNPEVVYFSGLLEYRNGDKISANRIWKPLLSMHFDTMRMHCIKREVLKFYFEGAPYLKAN
jgi:tetratricopeptide (TPR) repeat protein